ncbi:MAG TPA: FAD/NAD(P)-binding protein [Alphaproteobacteria bacterium]|nr:FAD/NAD(P)-binding protein [Alphaproteobacteria bacterium]
MSDSVRSIVVVGGGAAATLFLTHLSLQKTPFKEVTVYDDLGRYAKGIAYETHHPEHLLNVRAAGMSARDDNPGHFVDWLAAQGFSYAAGDFVPRHIYNQYLEDTLSGAVKHLEEAGVNISFKQEPVRAVRQSDGRYRIRTPQAEQYADAVVVATGNTYLAQPAGAETLSGQDGYFANPWEVDYKTISQEGHAIILGAGLSMVDALVSLRKNGFAGQVTVISRHGLLPMPHVPAEKWPVFFAEDMPVSACHALHTVRKQVAEARRKGISWQAVIDAIRPTTNKIWLSWDAHERAQFTRLLPYWNVHRHRMPSQSADIVAQWQVCGDLHICKDHVRGISLDEKGLRVKGRKDAYTATVVINCLGYKAATKGFEDLTGMTPQDMTPGLYALGPALSGYLFETTAIPEIRHQAGNIAREMTDTFSDRYGARKTA